MQIWEKFQPDYTYAMRRFKADRAIFLEELTKVQGLRVIPTQANYVMCEILGGCSARHLAEQLLDRHNILIKDLSSKSGVNGEYVRLAVRNMEDNRKLIRALGDTLRN